MGDERLLSEEGYKEARQGAINMSRLVAGSTAFVLGADPTMAAQTAQTATQENCFHKFLDTLVVVYDLTELGHGYWVGDEEAIKEAYGALATDTAMMVLPMPNIAGYARAGSKVAKTASTAFKSVSNARVLENPSAKSLKNVAHTEITPGKSLEALDLASAQGKNKNLPSRVRKVNASLPNNHELAGQVYPLEKLPLELRQKYPHSVPFTGSGFPDFARYAKKKVKIKMTGDSKDFAKADKAAGFLKRPQGYTWHHHHDGETMLLVPTNLHEAVRHTGGSAICKHNFKKSNK